MVLNTYMVIACVVVLVSSLGLLGLVIIMVISLVTFLVSKKNKNKIATGSQSTGQNTEV